MTTLALEFSSAQRSVAVARGGRVLADIAETGARGTNAFGMIENVLAAANIGRQEIELLAVGLGPGSYTGIRAAIAIAQGWQLARKVKLTGIGSVECLAAQAQAEKLFSPLNVVIDAQRGEFYVGTYDVSAAGCEELAPLKIVTAAQVGALAEKTLAGPGVTTWFPAGKNLFPSAAMLALLAAGRKDFSLGEKLEPVYLREAAFLKLAEQRKK